MKTISLLKNSFNYFIVAIAIGVVMASMMRKYCPMEVWEWIRPSFYTLGGIGITFIFFFLEFAFWKTILFFIACQKGKIKGVILDVK